MNEASLPPLPNRWQLFLHMQGIGIPHPIIMRIVHFILFSWVLVLVALITMSIITQVRFEGLRYVFATIFLLPPLGYLAWGIVAFYLTGKAQGRIDRYFERRARATAHAAS